MEIGYFFKLLIIRSVIILKLDNYLILNVNMPYSHIGTSSNNRFNDLNIFFYVEIWT